MAILLNLTLPLISFLSMWSQRLGIFIYKQSLQLTIESSYTAGDHMSSYGAINNIKHYLLLFINIKLYISAITNFTKQDK